MVLPAPKCKLLNVIFLSKSRIKNIVKSKVLGEKSGQIEQTSKNKKFHFAYFLGWSHGSGSKNK